MSEGMPGFYAIALLTLLLSMPEQNLVCKGKKFIGSQNEIVNLCHDGEHVLFIKEVCC